MEKKLLYTWKNKEKYAAFLLWEDQAPIVGVYVYTYQNSVEEIRVRRSLCMFEHDKEEYEKRFVLAEVSKEEYNTYTDEELIFHLCHRLYRVDEDTARKIALAVIEDRSVSVKQTPDRKVICSTSVDLNFEEFADAQTYWNTKLVFKMLKPIDGLTGKKEVQIHEVQYAEDGSVVSSRLTDVYFCYLKVEDFLQYVRSKTKSETMKRLEKIPHRVLCLDPYVTLHHSAPGHSASQKNIHVYRPIPDSPTCLIRLTNYWVCNGNSPYECGGEGYVFDEMYRRDADAYEWSDERLKSEFKEFCR